MIRRMMRRRSGGRCLGERLSDSYWGSGRALPLEGAPGYAVSMTFAVSTRHCLAVNATSSCKGGGDAQQMQT